VVRVRVMSAFLPPPIIDTEAVFEEAYKPSDEERVAIRAFAESHGDEFAEVPPGKILRFLRARDMQDKKATAMLRTHMTWFKKYKPNELHETDINQKALRSGCWRLLGKTEDGSPVLEVQVGLWNPHEYDKDDYVTYVGWFEAMLERFMQTHTQMVVIFDMTGWKLWHAKYVSYIQGLVDIAQNQYPERLRRVLMVSAPFIFKGVWAIIRPWLDSKTAAKVAFVTTEGELKQQFAALTLPLDLLPARYGGAVACDTDLPCPGFEEHMAR
jgi:hypothetical protein